MPENKKRAPRHRRSAAEVMNTQNILVLRKMVQEGLIPGERVSQLIREFDPTIQQKAGQ